MGITSLYVTHDQDEAMSMSDRIVVMNKGRVEQVATPAKSTYDRPRSSSRTSLAGQTSLRWLSTNWTPARPPYVRSAAA
jgi:iron(III) transport system ATP-binding protein